MTPRLPTSLRRSLLMTLLLALPACGSPEPIAKVPDSIALDKIPAEILAEARNQLPGVEFEQAWIEQEDGKTAYEIRGRDDQGKTREVKLSATGELIEIE